MYCFKYAALASNKVCEESMFCPRFLTIAVVTYWEASSQIEDLYDAGSGSISSLTPSLTLC